MRLDASKLLAVAAIVLGLIIRVGLLGATFGEGECEEERCREERPVLFVRRYADFVDFSADDSLSDVVAYASPCAGWSPWWESTRAPR